MGFPVLPVLLDSLETGMHPIPSPCSQSQIVMLLYGYPPLLRKLFFLISLSHLAPSLFPILASLPLSIMPGGFKACSPWDWGTAHWGRGTQMQ